MTPTLNELVKSALQKAGAGETNPAGTATPAIVKMAAAKPAVPSVDHGEFEKLAAACDFVGRRGVTSFIKTGSAPETDAGKKIPASTATVTPHNPQSPPMGGGGQPETNAAKKPGGGSPPNLGAMGTGDHHPALATNEAAIKADKTIKGKHEAPQLQAVLDAANPGNIHKAASAHDPELVRQALAKKLAEKAAANAAGAQ